MEHRGNAALSDLKQKFCNALGVFGAVIYYAFSLLVTVLPFVMIGAPFWLNFLFFGVVQFFPHSSVVFWLWGLVCAIQGKQDLWAYTYYALFGVLFAPFFLWLIANSFSGIVSQKNSEPLQENHTVRKSGAYPIIVFLLSVALIASISFNIRLVEKVGNKDDIINVQNRTVSELRDNIQEYKQEINELEDVAKKYTHIIDNLKFENLGYASDNFKTDQSIILVHRNDNNKKIKLTANVGTVTLSHSSNAAIVHFDQDRWSWSTTLSIEPNYTGVTVLTFSNSTNNDTFKVLIIVF